MCVRFQAQVASMSMFRLHAQVASFSVASFSVARLHMFQAQVPSTSVHRLTADVTALQTVAQVMREELEAHRESGCSNTLYDDALRYTATMCCSLMDKHDFAAKTWDLCFTPYIGPFVGESAKEACTCASPCGCDSSCPVMSAWVACLTAVDVCCWLFFQVAPFETQCIDGWMHQNIPSRLHADREGTISGHVFNCTLSIC